MLRLERVLIETAFYIKSYKYSKIRTMMIDFKINFI